MKNIKELLISYINEFRKSKKSAAFWLSLLAPLMLVGIFFLAYYFEYKHFIPKPGNNPWIQFVKYNIQNTAFMLLPFFIILITVLISQIEHKNNMFKQLFILPVSKSAIHFGKISFVISLLLLTMFYFIAILFICGYLLGILRSELRFLEFSPDYYDIISITTKLFISSLGILVIQYWLSIRFKNMIIPLGIGLSMYIASMIMMQGWEKIIYIPYAYTGLSVIEHKTIGKGLKGISNIYVFSLIYFTIGAILSYFDIRRTEIK